MIRNFAILCVLAVAGFGCAHDPYPASKAPEQTAAPAGETRWPAALSAETMMSRAMLADRRDDVRLDAANMAANKKLSFCQGSVSLKRKAGTLKLVINNADSCSNVLALNPQTLAFEKIGKFPKNENTIVEIDLNEKFGNNTFTVYLSSETGKTAAVINVTSFVKKPFRSDLQVDPRTAPDYTLSNYLFGRKWGELADCGGSVYMTTEFGKVYLNFYGVRQCSVFDVLTDNGNYSNFTNTRIDSNDRVEIPAEFYNRGYNSIKVLVKSTTGKTYDVFRIEFPAH